MKLAIVIMLVAGFVEPASAQNAGTPRPPELPERYDLEALSGDMEPDTGPLSAALQERFRDRIAGIYIEREPDFHVIVRLIGERDAGTLQYQLGEDRARVEVKTGAPHTLDELQAAFKQRETIKHYLPHGYGGYVDERTGDVVLTVEAGNEPSNGTETSLSEALGVPVRITVEERAVLPPRRQ